MIKGTRWGPAGNIGLKVCTVYRQGIYNSRSVQYTQRAYRNKVPKRVPIRHIELKVLQSTDRAYIIKGPYSIKREPIEFKFRRVYR